MFGAKLYLLLWVQLILKPHERCHSNENCRDACDVSFLYRRRNGNGFMHSKAGMTALQRYVLFQSFLNASILVIVENCFYSQLW
jgi:hypothetical protein